ncbi:hypothetical protein H4R35_004646 [Dimargaris xerosporica]|nr:hypothetical protein H4R35_004646 [Dimargaris xerosporica]
MATSNVRKSALIEAANRPVRHVAFPERDGRAMYPSEFYGEYVFTTKDMAKALPKPVFADFLKQKRGHQTLSKPTADAIAHAVRVWAMDRGATHFTHWFQPQTDTTAEKHDSFLSFQSIGGGEYAAIDAFSGSQLLQSEPDASSFPSGGMRSTFEARGYTVWDTTSPMFIQKAPNNTKILYVPSVFISYNGEALDSKTPLLRSCAAISKAAVELLSLISPRSVTSQPPAAQVVTTLGTEQEFFLIDRSMYAMRPDLKITGRTLMGNLPPRHQQLEDHYFGNIPTRVLSAMSELELELYKLGVPLKTRHNEVAPAQFELAPVFEEASVAVDHNLLTMELLHKVAHRHGLKALFHEKPFQGVNGSGKHCNWSLSTDRGENLLDPTVKPETNYRFLLFLVAVLDAVHKHAAILLAGISSSSNQHRLGANEAPPGIISVFLGDHLAEVLNAIEERRGLKTFSVPHFQSVKLGGTVVDLKVSSLPNITRDLTDRNRTSPFAFTGNKFEFRAVGSKQSPSFAVTLLNAAVAQSIREVTAALVEQKGSKEFPSAEDQLEVIRKYIIASKPIRFEGDNYSAEWVTEAEKRGLPNIVSAPAAYDELLKPAHSELLTKQVAILTPTELDSRYHILMERYAKDMLVESRTLLSMTQTQVLPAAFEHRKMLADSATGIKSLGLTPTVELEQLATTSDLLESLSKNIADLKALIKTLEDNEDVKQQAHAARDELAPLMEQVRVGVDGLEEIVGDKFWTLPKYTELLLTV